MQAIGLVPAGYDHCGGVLGDHGTAELIHVEVGTEQHDLVSRVTQTLGSIAGAIGIEATHHDAPPRHTHSVPPWRETPHTRTPPEVARASLQAPAHPVISTHSLAQHFDVTRSSPRLDEFVPQARRIPA